MKKVLVFMLLAGCSGYNYYETNIKYRQVGEDCIYSYTEDGERFNSEIRSLDGDKSVVYRNTRCSELYMKDSFGVRNDRKVFGNPVVEEAEQRCGCNKCAKKHVLKKRYVLLPDLIVD